MAAAASAREMRWCSRRRLEKEVNTYAWAYGSRERILTSVAETPRREMRLQVWRNTQMKRMFFTLVTAGLMAGDSGVRRRAIQERKENQQERIGERGGEWQPDSQETANLEKKEAGINREMRRDRAQNGGNLTNKEKAQVNRQQNRLSRQIYRDKHN